MKFSLKDLLRTVTLVCIGIVSGTLAYSMGDWPSRDIVVVPRFLFALAPGPFLGMAIGNLFHRANVGLYVGLTGQIILLTLVGAWVIGND